MNDPRGPSRTIASVEYVRAADRTDGDNANDALLIRYVECAHVGRGNPTMHYTVGALNRCFQCGQELAAAAESPSQTSDGPQPAGNGSGAYSASRLESGRWLASCSRCTYRAERSKRDAAEHALEVHLAYAHEVSSDA